MTEYHEETLISIKTFLLLITLRQLNLLIEELEKSVFITTINNYATKCFA